MHAVKPTIINTVSSFVWVAMFHRVATASLSHPDATITLQCWFYLLLCGLQSSIASQLPRRLTPTPPTPRQCCSCQTTISRRHSPCHRSHPGVGSNNLRQSDNLRFAMATALKPANAQHKRDASSSGIENNDGKKNKRQKESPKMERRSTYLEIK